MPHLYDEMLSSSTIYPESVQMSTKLGAYSTLRIEVQGVACTSKLFQFDKYTQAQHTQAAYRSSTVCAAADFFNVVVKKIKTLSLRGNAWG